MTLLDYKRKVLSGLQTLETESVIKRIDQVLEADLTLGTEDKKKWSKRLMDHILKYDIIQPLLDDSSISEIMINGLDPIFIETKGQLLQTPVSFESKEHLMQWVNKVATEVGREVNFSQPTLDARLQDGSRVNVVLDPIALNGPAITIRKFNNLFSKLTELVDVEMITHDLMIFLETCIQCKFNFMIAGGTGSGKTTLLSCLAAHIGPKERIVVIEDAAEIKTDHLPNVVRLETRNNNKQSPVSLSHLIKNALRMRPDRIIVGEVRGDESIEMLQAMNTGHDGSFSTGHSNSALDMLVRLEVLASTNASLDASLIKKQIISALDIIVYVERLPSGQRKVTYIGEVDKSAPDYALNSIYIYDEKDKGSATYLDLMINKHKLKRHGYA